MKFAIFSLILVSTSSFTTEQRRPRLVHRLYGMQRPDSSKEVAEALRISKQFGASSKEARVAWDIVEEMDSSCNEPAIQPTSTLTHDESISLDYKYQVNALTRLLDETKEKMEQIKTLAVSIQEMELDDPSLSKLPPEMAPLKTVLREAKAASEVHGPSSPEAIAAWEAVEGCVGSANGGECSVESMYRYSAAAIKAHHYYDAVIDTEFLQEAIDAVDTISSLRRFIRVESNRLGN